MSEHDDQAGFHDFELVLVASIKVSGRFRPERVAWPAGWSAKAIAAGAEQVYRADPHALLDVFPVEELDVRCTVAPLGEPDEE